MTVLRRDFPATNEPSVRCAAGWTTAKDPECNRAALARMFPNWHGYVNAPPPTRTVATIIVSRKPGATRPTCHESGELEGVIAGVIG